MFQSLIGALVRLKQVHQKVRQECKKSKTAKEVRARLKQIYLVQKSTARTAQERKLVLRHYIVASKPSSCTLL